MRKILATLVFMVVMVSAETVTFTNGGLGCSMTYNTDTGKFTYTKACKDKNKGAGAPGIECFAGGSRMAIYIMLLGNDPFFTVNINGNFVENFDRYDFNRALDYKDFTCNIRYYLEMKRQSR